MLCIGVYLFYVKIQLMIKVVPAIIPKSFSDLEDKIDIVSDFVDRVQIDISDGEFGENMTWPYTEGDELPNHDLPYKDSIDIELDLYSTNPEEIAGAWVDAGVKSVVIHLETIDDPTSLIDELKMHDIEVGLSINPSTKNSALDEWISQIDFVQMMGNDKVMFQGVELDKNVYDKIKELHKKYPDLEIAIDIGVNFETAPKLVKAGATKLISGSAIYDSENVEEAITRLESS
jgi:ribulose-phosphate 3-epimerase